MSEDRTAETGGSRSFEKRVFARFDSMDARFDRIDVRFDGVEIRLDRVEMRLNSVEDRVGKLEAKQYDTKPIWERAVADIESLRTQMQTGFENIRIEMDEGFRKTANQIDVLNRTILEVRADLRYFDRRITKLESDTVEPR